MFVCHKILLTYYLYSTVLSHRNVNVLLYKKVMFHIESGNWTIQIELSFCFSFLINQLNIEYILQQCLLKYKTKLNEK